MGGQCVCTNQGSIEASMIEFFENMKLRSYSVENYITSIKRKIQMGKINEKNWNDLVDTYLALDNMSSLNESYRNYFCQNYSDFPFERYVLSLLFLCQKDTTLIKQKFLDLLRPFKMQNIIKKTEDDRYTFIDKNELLEIIIIIVSLFSFKAVKYVSEIKNFDSSLTREMNKNYSEEKVKQYSLSLIDKAINPKLKNVFTEGVILINDETSINLTEYIDYDYFYEELYPILVDDKRLREEIYVFDINKSKSLK